MDAWVNWNPDPLIHAYGAALGVKRRFVALCRVSIREHWANEFDPDHPRACPTCASFVRDGLSWEQVKDRPIELGPDAIICRRPS